MATSRSRPAACDSFNVVEETRYFGGLGEQTVSSGASRYYHADLIGSTSLMTDDAGDPPATGPRTLYYTAFGEAIVYDTGESEWKVATTQPSGSPRYQYAGAHGYESNLLVLEGKPGTKPITLKHVGARWYQPDIGRFVQRDPIGLAGGANCYEYVTSSPHIYVDPFGLAPPHTGGFPAINKIPIGDIWSILNKPITWSAIRQTTIGTVTAYSGLVASVGYGFWCIGDWLVVTTPIEDWVGAALVSVVGPGTGPGCPIPGAVPAALYPNGGRGGRFVIY